MNRNRRLLPFIAAVVAVLVAASARGWRSARVLALPPDAAETATDGVHLQGARATSPSAAPQALGDPLFQIDMQSATGDNQLLGV